MNWRLLPYDIGAPAWNMAVDEAIYYSYRVGLGPPTLRFYGWNPPTLSVGYFQSIDKEVDLTALANLGFGLVRRNTGGRAVLHNKELTYSVVAGVKDGLPESLMGTYLYISKALVGACRSFGVLAELHEGVSNQMQGTGACFESPSWYELTANERKLVGSAQLRQQGSFLQQGSILIDFSAEDLGAVLKNHRISMEEWVIKINRKVTSFKDQGIVVNVTELAKKIIESFQKLYNIEIREGILTQAELAMIDKLIPEKYANDQWNLIRNKSDQQLQQK
jgi:lipoyl(octanoyl) transferase